MDFLHVSSVTKVYDSGDKAVTAISNASFGAGEGEFISIVGPSGSGKTTLLAMLGGLLTPTSGTISVAGQELGAMSRNRLAAYRRQRVGFVFQGYNLLPYLSARDNLLLMSRLTGRVDKAARRRADQLLDELGLTERARAYPAQMSGGERQRVAIGRALMNDPALILVDEPTANLDSARGRQVVELLRSEVQSRGKTALMVTHDLRMAELAGRCLRIDDGVLSAERGAWSAD